MRLRHSPTLLVVLCGLLLGSSRADASFRHPRSRPIHTVRVNADGAGTVIAVEFAGRARPRLIHSATPVDALAVTDVDNDGDLDILAASMRDGLVLWRNAGRGHFVLARASAECVLKPRPGAWLTGRSDRNRVSTDADRLEAEISRTSIVQVYFDTVPLVLAADDAPPHRPHRPRPSRAPPPSLG